METWLYRPRLCITTRCDILDGKSHPRLRAYTDKTLTLERFREDFKNWPLRLFTEANAGVRLCLRDLLQKKGIETKKESGDAATAFGVPKFLYEIIKLGKTNTTRPIFAHSSYYASTPCQ
ncbi:hypothetical protein E4U22_004752 [Claviceps purpurea]|nr:hypothetical protein E4U22_004752 [Claviceps purpurea]